MIIFYPWLYMKPNYDAFDEERKKFTFDDDSFSIVRGYYNIQVITAFTARTIALSVYHYYATPGFRKYRAILVINSDNVPVVIDRVTIVVVGRDTKFDDESNIIVKKYYNDFCAVMMETNLEKKVGLKWTALSNVDMLAGFVDTSDEYE